MDDTPNIQADIKAITAMRSIPVILDVICRTTGMGFAAVARVTEDRWVACAVKDNVNFGLKAGSELEIRTTLCDEVREFKEEIVVDDFDLDTKYRGHHTPLMYGLRSYISVPIWLKGGRFFGTLCAVDADPATVNNPETIGMFNLYAELIALHYDNCEQLEVARTDLLHQKELAVLREQFIAVLGHDLRNPVGTVKNVAQLMQSHMLDDVGIQRFAGVLISSHNRMMTMINNLTDLARGRMGEGIAINPAVEQMEQALQHVLDDIQLIWPDRTLQFDALLDHPVYCDSKRVAQLFGNLLSNAFIHGAADGVVYVKASSSPDKFSISVQNLGKPIPQDALINIFEPFARGYEKPGKDGLGLGLYIAAEIARAHGGKLEVWSDDGITIFTFTTPNNIYQ